MKRSLVLAAVAAVAVASAAVLAQTSPRRDGNWQITVEMEMPGMPMKMPPRTITQCVTPEQAENPNTTVPSGSPDKNNDCKVSDYKLVGNKVTWSLKCTTPQPITGNGEIVYSGDAYDGWMKMKMEAGEMTMKYKGKRLGDCTK